MQFTNEELELMFNAVSKAQDNLGFEDDAEYDSLEDILNKIREAI